ncbi:hypothetical protein K466DRAFT_604102 [Polyporus arcularius HHB13444]|uniref:Uncharacterized protein n=1 Tax=Polyporus arcularius HHB13444 TaxID=1314778 RepID=A0A5C3NX07_9APHY|nr:hypothetical protein K466DRAFT_604102 [Polyporus arcularius HHB13444]
MPPSTASRPAPSSQRACTKEGVLLEDLKFNVVGLRGLRGYLGDGDVYKQFQARFDAADMAWFVAGAHKDGAHFLSPDRFHTMWKDARVVEASGTDAIYRARREFRDRLRELVWDALTVLDRVSGGASILVHSPGTVEPGQRRELPFLKLDVYVPPFILHENFLVDRPLASIVQTFAEEVALPAAQRWARASEALGFDLKKEVPVVEPPSNLPFMPAPQRRNTLYRCRGRRVGELEAMLAQASDDASRRDRDGPGRRDGHASRSSATARDDDDNVDSLRATIARLEVLLQEKHDEIVVLGDIIDDREGDVLRLEDDLEAREIDIARLEEEVEALQRAPPVLVPQPIRAQRPAPEPMPTPTPTPTPSRSACSPVQPDRLPAAAPPYVAVPIAVSTTSMSLSRSCASRSTAASSPLPSPSPSHLRSPGKMDRAMPATIWQSPALVVTTSTSAIRAPTSTRPATLTRFDFIGPRSQVVVAAHRLPSTLHRSLRDLVLNQPQSLWYSLLTGQMSLSQEVALELIRALEEDVPSG